MIFVDWLGSSGEDKVRGVQDMIARCETIRVSNNLGRFLALTSA